MNNRVPSGTRQQCPNRCTAEYLLDINSGLNYNWISLILDGGKI